MLENRASSINRLFIALTQAQAEHRLIDEEQAFALATVDDTAALMKQARILRDQHFGQQLSYSRKVFIPLTQLCRDVCHYCTFAQTPSKLDSPFMTVEEVLKVAREGAAMGCREALFTLGERPELRYSAARKALAELGFSTTLEYLAHVAEVVQRETGLLPHINAGCMSDEEMLALRKVSFSMGIMLESASTRLCEKGQPHYGSPDKDPAVRMETIDRAGQHRVPFTSGILIGIGETRRERIESLLLLRRSHLQYGQLQEIIVQNFRAKPGTLMAQAPEPDLNELLWTIAVAKIIFGAEMSIQAPPNLSPGVLENLVNAGINDWGGVSPLTPDFVNPEAPWPHLDKLRLETASAGKTLVERLTIYPSYVHDKAQWLDSSLHRSLYDNTDSLGMPRTDDWATGGDNRPPESITDLLSVPAQMSLVADEVVDSVARARAGERLSETEIVRLFAVHGAELAYVCEQADQQRQQVCGETITHAVNRNINYTNICYFKCKFCAFSKGKSHADLRGKPYDISLEEIQRRCVEAWQRGATEVCLQGGIHPDYTGDTYLAICRAIKQVVPEMHIHAFSPLEVAQGAETLGLSLRDFLLQLKQAGLDTLPGTAAEILDDEVRETLCSDKLNTSEWLEVIETAHSVGLKTTSTIMYGHIERPEHWARHLLHLRDLQQRTGMITELVPLPFVGKEAPMYLRGHARPGPTFREAILMHAVARLVLAGQIDNIQTSWVKMGRAGVETSLRAGANDLGGSLMNESITRAAGASVGQEWTPAYMEEVIAGVGRQSQLRNTLYGEVDEERRQAAYNAADLTDVINEMSSSDKRFDEALIIKAS
ncbi:FO synthase subunit 1 /FO synthase subunit 2 [Sinobacterium caligoides]|uniref:FO synthase n=1 Tax=Sinobacterium caligoides TaxID=933926 RepID=A0A3N2DN06_9GAMM|nr:5-amino-6-(D-ribitylamino)uracil--L-tyrosine 4-hydroxyphenyl transferase CofH [Sinobacterium caligoides]ROS01150.1 FO synthase subunit 1 /FO synthase subunit 2 [Sinobacterium caligoides]